jgi:transcriptional regulator with GAF, ATPase, and Fis domain
MNLDTRIHQLEKGMIIDALKRTNGVQSQAAKILGIKERSLWHRVKKFKIDASVFKDSEKEG